MDNYLENNYNKLLLQPSCIPLPLSDDILNEIVPAAKDYALLNGAGMRYRGRYNSQILEMAPFFLFPSPFPSRDFEYVKELQPHINILMHKIAHDYDFLYSCLKNTIQVDDFTSRLWNIYETVRKEGITQLLVTKSGHPVRSCRYGVVVIGQRYKNSESNLLASS